jgi:branched-chain amino acid transport system permease protein
MSYVAHILICFNIYAIAALGLNLVVGYRGLLTLAHAAYFAVGAYVYALVTMHLGWGFAPSAALAMLIGGGLSLAASLPAWRFRGDAFVLVTLAVQTFLFSLMYNWSNTNYPPGTWWNLTNGPYGLSGIPGPAICGIHFDTIWSIAALSTLFLLASVLVFGLLQASPWGRLLKSIRDDELAARSLGKSVRLATVYVLAMACAFAALAGAIYSAYATYIDPSIGSLDQSILLLCVLVVGGSGNLRGPLIGTAVLLLIPEILRVVELSGALASNVRLLAYGLLLILMIHWRPQGIAGEYKLE